MWPELLFLFIWLTVLLFLIRPRLLWLIFLKLKFGQSRICVSAAHQKRIEELLAEEDEFSDSLDDHGYSDDEHVD